MEQITQIIILISQILIFGTSIVGLSIGHKKIQSLHISLNSRLDQLIESVRKEGIEVGRLAEVERRKNSKNET